MRDFFARQDEDVTVGGVGARIPSALEPLAHFTVARFALNCGTDSAAM